MPSKRLFVAIELPEVVGGEVVRLGTSIPGVRWHPPEKLHLTLAFLGDYVEADVQRKLHETLRSVRGTPFFLPLAGTGWFGGERPRALWVGAGDGGAELGALHRAVQEAVRAAGGTVEGKKFVPHVTVAYCGRDTPAGAVARWAEANAGFDAGRMRVVGFSLFSSAGGIYSKESSVCWPSPSD